MNKSAIFALTAALSIAGSAAAQSKIDLGGRARLRSEKAMYSSQNGPARLVAQQAEVMRAFVTLNDGYAAADLADIPGLEVQGGRGQRLMAQFPAEAIDALEASPAVAAVQLERPVEAKMDVVRSLTGVDLIHQGSDLPQAYTGEGVLCALVDGGFDPNHVNFLNADGTNRIENFTYFRPLQNGGYNTETYDAAYMPTIDTESSETFHGTHTMGIMAGSYRGKVNAGILDIDADGRMWANTAEIDNPYYGVAPDADLAVAAGASTDYYVALGIDQILNYAYWKAGDSGKTVPVVLNLSIGSNVGPHDGSSNLSRYIDQEVEYSTADVPFVPVIAAGNEGDLKIACHKRFDEEDTEMKTAFMSYDLLAGAYPKALYGQVYIYSDTDEPFEVQAVMINKTRGRVALQNALSPSPEGAAKYFCSSAEYVQDSETDQVSPMLARYFEGYLGLMAQLDTQESGRYVAVVDMMLWETSENQGNYCIGLIVKGQPGQRVDAYCAGEWFDFSPHGLEANGYVDGSSDGTISDVACGYNTVVVGSYNARNYWANVDGTIGGYDGGIFYNNKVSDFTSWGTLADGRSLPLVCAPGATVISSSNEYYIQDNGVANGSLQATWTDGNRRYSWHQCVGTSMSTPVVAGSIALWMQADPTLTVSEIQDIITCTAKVDADVEAGNRVQWGAGKFDAYAGLKEVLTRQAAFLPSVADENKLMTRMSGDCLELFLPGAESMDAALYTPAGAIAWHAKADGDTARLPIAGLKGVYIVTVNGNHTTKIVL